MTSKKLATLLLAILTVLTMVMAVACNPIGADPDFSAMNSSSIEDSGPGTEIPPIAEILEEVPESTLKISSTAGSQTANSNWFIEYGEEAIEFIVYVVDEALFTADSVYSNDAIEVRIAKEQDLKGISAGAICVIVDAGGAVLVKNLATNTEVVDSGVTAEVVEFTFENQTIDGYYVKLAVPYSATEVSSENKDAALHVALRNSTDMITSSTVAYEAFGSVTERVNSWFLVEDSNVYAENPYLHIKIDALFIGDSYIDKAFWNVESTYDKTMAAYGINAVNLGVGGTQIDYWMEDERVTDLGYTYAPTHLVAHIGVNDIDDANQDANATAAELVELFELYHATFEDAQIYWVSLIPNCVFTQKIEIYKAVNEAVEAWAQDKEWITYVNEWDTFCSDEVAEGSIVPVKNMFKVVDTNLEGMHLNHDYGYPTWAALILKAMGYNVASGSVMGNSEAAGLYHSPDWKFDTEENQAESTGAWEKAAWVKDVYATDVLFEAEVKSPAAVQYDRYPKVGLTLRADDVQVFAYVDFGENSASVGNGTTNIVYRKFGKVAENADWNWGGQAGFADIHQDITQKYIKLGIAKLGDTVYMLADGKVINTMKVPGLAAATKVGAGVMGFNQIIHVKGVQTTTVAEEIEYALLPTRSISAQEYDNTTITVDKTTAKKGDTVTFTVETTDPISAVYVNGVAVTANEGVYSFVMEDVDVVISIAFLGKLSVDLSAVADKVEASTLTPYEGDTVTFAESETARIVKLYANGVEILPVEGVYSVVASEDLVITGEFYNKINGIVLDGEIDEVYEDSHAYAGYNDNRSITLHGIKVERGVIIHVTAIMNTKVSGTANWWESSNFEFHLNNGGQMFVNIDGQRGSVADSVWKTQEVGGKWHHTVELFVENSVIRQWSADGDVQLNYAWKTVGETAFPVANATNFWAFRDHWTSDWLQSHSGGLDLGAKDFTNGYGQFGIRTDNIRITKTGLIDGFEPDCGTIDGIADEYEGLATVFRSNANNSYTVRGKAADDGLYLAITINHKSRSAYTDNKGDWWINDNIEFTNIGGIGGSQVVVYIANGEVRKTAFWDRAEMTTSGEEGNYTTTVELYAAGVAKAYELEFGINGDGFSRDWLFSNRLWITPTGVQETGPDFVSDAVLDGVLNDAIYSEAVKASAISTLANGANVEVIGVSGSYGVHFGVTVKHNRPITQQCKEDGSQWWHYMGIEFRLGGRDIQVATTTWNNTAINCSMGYTNVDNGDGTYTTVYEIFVPYWVYGGAGKTAFVMGGVFETDFAHLFGNNGWGNGLITHYVTENGIVAA